MTANEVPRRKKNVRKSRKNSGGDGAALGRGTRRGELAIIKPRNSSVGIKSRGAELCNKVPQGLISPEFPGNSLVFIDAAELLLVFIPARTN